MYKSKLKTMQNLSLQQRQPSLDHDSVIIFSNPDSPEGSLSPPSHSYHSSSSSPTLKNGQLKKTESNLSITDLSYTINPKWSMPSAFSGLLQNPKPVNILKSINFIAKSSEILAVVGPSGTGKTTLLRLISGRIEVKHFDPKSILINGEQITSQSQLRKTCGFVAQEDNLLPLLTVKETLMFSAKFRLRGKKCKELELNVENLLHELGLVLVANTFVGDEENRGVSGGERKRVSIGVDIIHDPKVLILDEPTSGLDSKSALQVIQLLSKMAKNKDRTIVLSIHQPSYRILQYISNFLVLSHGSIVHDGNIDLLQETISKMGFDIPIQLNAIEFSMEIIDKLEAYANSKKDLPIIEGNEPSSPFRLPWPGEVIIRVEQHNHTDTNMNSVSTFFEIMFLCSRFWKIIYRTRQLFFARTMQALVAGFGLASVFTKVKKDENGVAERLGLFAFSLSFLLSSTVEALPIYLQERRVIMKEASRGAYKISSYIIANTIVFTPFLLFVSIIFSVPVYWIVGLNPSIKAFAFFTLTVWLIVLMASSLVLFLSAVSPDFISGNSLICTVLGAFFLFSGYFIPMENIPKYWLFMYYISLYRYPLDSLLINEYWNVRDECFSRDYARWYSNKCLVTGNNVLESRGLYKDTRLMNVGIMFGFFMLYRLLCWVILARRTSKTTI